MNDEAPNPLADIAIALEQALSEILEKSAFMFSEKAEDPARAFEGIPCVCATIAFNGPTRGELRLVAPTGFGVQVAANTLGEEADTIGPEQADDALKELINVICGKFLETVSGAKVIYNLSIPTLTPISDEEIQALAAETDSAVAQVDNISILIHAKTV